MKNLQDAFEYYMNNEPHLKSQIINKFERLNEITMYSAGGVSNEYQEAFNERTSELKNNADKYTAEHLKNEYEAVINELNNEYDEKLSAISDEKKQIINDINQRLDESKKVCEIKNKVDSNDMIVMQNKLKSDFGMIRSTGLSRANDIINHLKENIGSAKYNKTYGHTLATVLFMYDEQIADIPRENFDDGHQTLYHNLKQELIDTLYNDRYKADDIVQNELNQRYVPGVTTAPLNMAKQAMKQKTDTFINKVKRAQTS